MGNPLCKIVRAIVKMDTGSTLTEDKKHNWHRIRPYIPKII